MKNISTNNEPLELKLGKSYYVIDALYLDAVKIGLSKNGNSIENIKEDVFPYNDTPFTKYKAASQIFDVKNIKVVINDEINCIQSSFSTDTGLIIFINEDIFLEFLENYSFDKLVNSDEKLINQIYWEELTSKYNLTDVGLILASINSGSEFEGSGTYQIIQTKNVLKRLNI